MFCSISIPSYLFNLWIQTSQNAANRKTKSQKAAIGMASPHAFLSSSSLSLHPLLRPDIPRATNSPSWKSNSIRRLPPPRDLQHPSRSYADAGLRAQHELALNVANSLRSCILINSLPQGQIPFTGYPFLIEICQRLNLSEFS